MPGSDKIKKRFANLSSYSLCVAFFFLACNISQNGSRVMLLLYGAKKNNKRGSRVLLLHETKKQKKKKKKRYVSPSSTSACVLYHFSFILINCKLRMDFWNLYQTSLMESFWLKQLTAFKLFCEKAPSQMFHRVLNIPVVDVPKLYPLHLCQ